MTFNIVRRIWRWWKYYRRDVYVKIKPEWIKENDE